MLSSRVSIPSPPHQTQEDIFSSSISSLFTDDTQNSHGTPGQAVIYHSPRYGEIKLGIPQHPDAEEGRNLFAHYLWNAGVVAAEAIETASVQHAADTASPSQEHGGTKWDRRYWDMKGKDILELGAGTALPSIVSAKSFAKSITITDHPSSPSLTTNTISQNVRENLQGTEADSSTTQITIAGLTWGDTFFTLPTQYGKLLTPQPAQRSFDRIIIADCLWLPAQHRNLVQTINLWLRDQSPSSLTSTYTSHPDPDPNPNPNPSPPCALIIAGFHTGRSIIASFFEIATGTRNKSNTVDKSSEANDEVEVEEEEDAGTNIDGDNHRDANLSIAQIFEVDVNLNVRDWVAEREGENKEQLKRWCVCAVLVRKEC